MERYAIMVKGIVRYEGKYLLVKRWYDDRIENPYQWEFVDGQIEFGEEPDKAVIRRIREQTGLQTIIDRIVYTWSYMVGDVHHIGISYECMALGDEVILSEELHDSLFVPKEQFRDYITNGKLLGDLERAFDLR